MPKNIFSGSASAKKVDAKASRLLIVEDERIVARALQEQLRHLGYKVAGQAHSGEEAIRQTEALRPDLVLMDVKLEGPMDGVEAAQVIRDRFRIPVVFLTAYSTKDVLARAKAAEPFGYILKPYQDRELDVVIEMAVYKHELAKQREETLALLDVAIDSMPGLFYLFDESGKVLRWNKNVEIVTGYSSAEIADMGPLDFFEGDEQGLAEEKIGEVFHKGHAAVELHLVAKNGTRTPYYYMGRLVQWSGRPCVIGTGVDLTQRRQLEEQFRQAQKMEAIGRLAGGVAHDFNNLLTIINGYCSILLATLQEHAKAREIVEQIGKAGERAASLTQQLLAYGRKQILHPKIFDLNKLLSEVDLMLVGAIGEDIELFTNPAPAPCTVKADPHQLEQVILNLAINARDAMPRGGKLTIATERVELDDNFTSESGEARPGPYARLTVTDTGTGMDAATRSRIFEPFFTTKEQGKGTGLGLATVFGIVKQSGGHIRVFSELGQGSSFQVYLPLWPDEVETIPTGQDAEDLPRGTETVLLVEDEQAVRYLSYFILKRSGYNVLQAANGVEALEVCARHAGPIDILATDVVMPRMGGRQLAETLVRLYPDIRVLFISGYAQDVVFRQGVLDAKHSFLQKPFSLSDLSKKIRSILDRK